MSQEEAAVMIQKGMALNEHEANFTKIFESNLIFAEPVVLGT